MTPHDKLVAELEQQLAAIEPGEVRVSLPDGSSYITNTFALAAQDLLATINTALDAVEPEKKDEHPTEDGVPVETYGYEEEYNSAIAACVSARKELLGQ